MALWLYGKAAFVKFVQDYVCEVVGEHVHAAEREIIVSGYTLSATIAHHAFTRHQPRGKKFYAHRLNHSQIHVRFPPRIPAYFTHLAPNFLPFPSPSA